jgi:hypothetical protein
MIHQSTVQLAPLRPGKKSARYGVEYRCDRCGWTSGPLGTVAGMRRAPKHECGKKEGGGSIVRLPAHES